MFEILKQRYQRNFVRYVALGKITKEQYLDIVGEKQEVEQIEKEI